MRECVCVAPWGVWAGQAESLGLSSSESCDLVAAAHVQKEMKDEVVIHVDYWS